MTGERPGRNRPGYTGEQTGQGEIILRTKRRRQIFIGGLILDRKSVV